MNNEIKFNACKYLDFSDSYAAKKETIIIDGQVKVYWHRPVIDNTYPSKVQFCKKRGRLNSPFSCLNCHEAMCSDFEDSEHTVIDVTKELDK